MMFLFLRINNQPSILQCLDRAKLTPGHWPKVLDHLAPRDWLVYDANRQSSAVRTVRLSSRRFQWVLSGPYPSVVNISMRLPVTSSAISCCKYLIAATLVVWFWFAEHILNESHTLWLMWLLYDGFEAGTTCCPGTKHPSHSHLLAFSEAASSSCWASYKWVVVSYGNVKNDSISFQFPKICWIMTDQLSQPPFSPRWLTEELALAWDSSIARFTALSRCDVRTASAFGVSCL